MRTTFVVLALSLCTACTDAFVTAPLPVAAMPGTLSPVRGTIMVDGVVIRQSDIDPLDIEHVEIIKSAAATTLYGEPTRCPAIIVHTKRPTTAPRPDP